VGRGLENSEFQCSCLVILGFAHNSPSWPRFPNGPIFLTQVLERAKSPMTHKEILKVIQDEKLRDVRWVYSWSALLWIWRTCSRCRLLINNDLQMQTAIVICRVVQNLDLIQWHKAIVCRNFSLKLCNFSLSLCHFAFEMAHLRIRFTRAWHRKILSFYTKIDLTYCFCYCGLLW
jgi:hypothetical protein